VTDSITLKDNDRPSRGSGQDDNDKSGVGATEKVIPACTKCGATRVAKSRPKNLDGLITRFLPRRPYRCLHCYHRFWQPEKFFADKRRTWSWTLLVVALLLLILLNRQVGDDYTGRSMDRSYNDPQFNTDLLLGNQSGVIADNGARKNTEQTRPPINPPKQIEKAPSQEEQREIIKNVDFSQPKAEPVIDQPVSAEELRRRLAEAKVKAETAARINQKKQVDLVEQLKVDDDEMRSLLKIDINFFIEQWRQAWQEGDSERYLNYYSGEFVPINGLTIEMWRELRRKRVTPSKNIKLSLSNFSVAFDQDNQRSVVTFDQFYQSGSFRDESRKQLTLTKEKEWKIISEREINR